MPPWCAALGALQQRGLVLFYIRPRVAVCESFCFYRALVGGWVVVSVRWARFLARGKLAHVTCSFLKVRSVTGTTNRLGVTDRVCVTLLRYTNHTCFACFHLASCALRHTYSGPLHNINPDIVSAYTYSCPTLTCVFTALQVFETSQERIGTLWLQ